MITNSQKRAGGGQSLAQTDLQVLRAVTAGQDLFVNEAGDIAPSSWFTGTPCYLDNTANMTANSTYKVIAGDVCTFDNDNAYVAYVSSDLTNTANALLHVKKVNPITGELLATSVLTLAAGLDFNSPSATVSMHVLVVPVSSTVVSVVVSCVSNTNVLNASSIKLTVSGSTFTNGGWAAITSTTGMTQGAVIMFSGVTGTANRWGYLVRPVTDTTAVAYLYKHASNSITPVTLSFSSLASRNAAMFAIKEGSDDLLWLIADNLSNVVVRSIVGSSATTTVTGAIDISSSFTLATGFISVSSTQIHIGGNGPIAGAKNTTRVMALTLNAGVTTLTAGTVVTLPMSKIPPSTTLRLAIYANGMYVFTSSPAKRFLLQPPDGNSGDEGALASAGTIWVVKGTVSGPSAAVADFSTNYVPPAAKLEEANWSPAATKRLRIIYCPYYKMGAALSGFGGEVDSVPLRCDFPWLFMPDFVYGTCKNALTYVGSAVASIAANATGAVLLSTNAVKLNGNLTPVKTIKNGVIALNAIWGVKIPVNQRNDSGMDPLVTPATTVAIGNAGVSGGNSMELGAWAGVAFYVENQKGKVVAFTQSLGSVVGSSHAYSVLAYVDGRAFAMSVMYSTTQNGALRNEFTFTDHLFFTFGNSFDKTSPNATSGRVLARVIANSLESRYHE